MYFYYNMMLNFAIMLCGVGLACVGKDLGTKEAKVQKIRKYLKKEKTK